MEHIITISNKINEVEDPQMRRWRLRLFQDVERTFFHLTELGNSSYTTYRVYYSHDLVQKVWPTEDPSSADSTIIATSSATDSQTTALSSSPPSGKFDLDRYLRSYVFKINTPRGLLTDATDICREDPVDPAFMDSMYKTLIYWLVMCLDQIKGFSFSLAHSPATNLCRDVMDDYCAELFPKDQHQHVPASSLEVY